MASGTSLAMLSKTAAKLPMPEEGGRACLSLVFLEQYETSSDNLIRRAITATADLFCDQALVSGLREIFIGIVVKSEFCSLSRRLSWIGFRFPKT